MIPLYRARVDQEALPEIGEVLKSEQLAEGKWVREFEERFADFIGNDSVVACSDVSNGITMALYASGVRPGDDVICSPMACLAANMPVRTLFANAIWCDVDPATGNMNPTGLADVITPRTKAIIVTHWGGDVADLGPIHSFASERRIAVIEDASEALAAEWQGCKIGNSGSDFTVFSFYPNKHLTTIDGGCISFRDPLLLNRIKYLKRYSIPQPNFRDAIGEIDPNCDIAELGYSAPMNNVAAAVGLRQLAGLEDVVAHHRSNSDFFDEVLKNVSGITTVSRTPNTRSAAWVYTLLAERRDDLMNALRSRGVYASRMHFRNDRYSCFNTPAASDLPGTDRFSDGHLSIPCGWWVTDEDREHISSAISKGW